MPEALTVARRELSPDLAQDDFLTFKHFFDRLRLPRFPRSLRQ
jgi:hypothetical protein